MRKIIIAAAIVVSAAFALVSKKKDSVYDNEPEQKNPMENKKVKFVEDENDKENADGYGGIWKLLEMLSIRPGFMVGSLRD